MTSSLRGSEGVARMGIWGDFQGLTEATREGGGSKKVKIEVTSFMDGPLS